MRNTLVAGEIALSLALLIGAGLLLRTFAHLRATEVGVQPAKVLTAEVKLPESKYKTFDQRREFQKLPTTQADRLIPLMGFPPRISRPEGAFFLAEDEFLQGTFDSIPYTAGPYTMRNRLY